MIDNIRQKIVYQMPLERRGGNLPTPFSASGAVASVTCLCPTHQLSEVASASGCCAAKCLPADKATPPAWRSFQGQPCTGMKRPNPSAVTRYSFQLLLWNVY